MLDTVTVIGYSLILFMLFIGVMNKEISIGSFAAVFAALSRIYSFMDELVSERLATATENSASAENFLDFISEKVETKASFSNEGEFEIHLKNVSFSYPNNKNKALANINLDIKKGETVAIVGENGSGKSTLCKIISSLYAPESGDVFYNETSLCKAYLDKTSAIFQDYMKYKLTLKENIAISQMGSLQEDDRVFQALREVDLKIDQAVFAEGLNTILGREFDGIELSGGQWQRVAIARGLYRESSLMILDEPTAAIDPLKESQLYNEFVNICKNKTTIIVTHRLGSAKIADKIVVLKSGMIVQQGNHNSLLDVDGEYKEMYISQSKWYR